MLSITRVATILSLALALVASPIVTVDRPVVRLPFSKRVNGLDVVASDHGRLKHLSAHSTLDVGNELAVRDPSRAAYALNDGKGYVATISVGKSAQAFNVTIDTGSALTWVGAGATKYAPSDTSFKTTLNISTHYAIGSVNTTVYLDTVSLGHLTASNHTIGVAYGSESLYNDGILGLGPTGMLKVEDGSSIPTFADTLFDQGLIPVNLFALSFEPFGVTSMGGELTFGDVDASKYNGDITYTARTTLGRTINYWGITQSIAYGSSIILSNGTGVVDSGTTLTYIPTHAFKQYKDAIGAQERDNYYYISKENYNTLESLYFEIEGTKFEFTPNAQIMPRAAVKQVHDSDDLLLSIQDLGTFGNGNFTDLDFVMGYTFLERFYTVFDNAHHRVGFATTSHTNATTN